MRPHLRKTLFLFLGYAVLVALSITVARRQLDAQTQELMTHTAELIGVEVARTVEKQAGQAVDREGPLGRIAVVERVIGIIDGSEAVRAASFVDAGGEVLASGRLGDIGKELAAPVELFGSSTEPRLTAVGSGGFTPSTYLLEIPLLEREELRGYFRIELSTAEFAPFYRQLHRQILLLAVAGFLSLGLLAFLLHLQLRRSEDVMVRGLERLTADDPPDASDTDVRLARELPRARKAVDSVAKVLGDSRREREAGDRRWEETVQRIDVGLIGIGPDGPRWVNRRALELLELGDEPASRARAAEMIRGALGDETVPGDESPRVVEIETVGPLGRRNRRLRVEEERIGGERLFFLHDQDALDGLAVDLRHATRLRSLMHLYLGVAHDLKAPINSMLMNLQLARRRVDRLGAEDEESGEKLAQDLEIVEKELGRLHRALERLLSRTAPETDERKPCDLVVLLRSTNDLLAPQARQQGIELEVVEPDEPVIVEGNRDRLEQAILSIAINGLEAIGREGRLTLQLGAEPESARISITDDGPGIPAALLPRIFEMRMTTKENGNGIGLFVARSILEDEHGGRIGVRSTEGAGTSFEITLPRIVASGGSGSTGLEAAAG